MPPPVYHMGGGMVGEDPFAYTGGSLLTPWTRVFTPPAANPFGGSPWDPSRFMSPAGNVAATITPERISAPEKFSYGDFAMPTAATMQLDPGYQFRLDQGRRQLEAGQAAKGLVRTGGSLKDILSFGQDLASQEYGNAYNRARDVYGINRSNAAENFDRNWAAQFQQQSTNAANALTAGQANAQNQLNAARLNFDINQGNAGLSRLGYQDLRDIEDQRYTRALGEYNLARNIFGENQANQFNRLSSMAGLGNPAGYASSMADLFGQYGNAQAAGRVGSANAWTNALSNIGGAGMDAAALYQFGRTPNTGVAGPYRPGVPNPYDQFTW